MIHHRSRRAGLGPAPTRVPVVLVLVATLAVGIVALSDGAGHPLALSPAAPSSATTAPVHVTRDESAVPTGSGPTPPSVKAAGRVAAVSGGSRALDERSATVANLEPALLAALREAAAAALSDGVELHVNSGWRSAARQEQLLRDAVAEYGSEKEARRWVATPETSAHVSGDAVDLGPSDATAWLSRHGAAYGLCQIYRNEPWHYELRTGAADHGCPAMYADPTQDPRMQR